MLQFLKNNEKLAWYTLTCVCEQKKNKNGSIQIHTVTGDTINNVTAP